MERVELVKDLESKYAALDAKMMSASELNNKINWDDESRKIDETQHPYWGIGEKISELGAKIDILGHYQEGKSEEGNSRRNINILNHPLTERDYATAEKVTTDINKYDKFLTNEIEKLQKILPHAVKTAEDTELTAKKQKVAEFDAGLDERVTKYKEEYDNSRDYSDIPEEEVQFAMEGDDQYFGDFVGDKEEELKKELGIDKIEKELKTIELSNKEYGLPRESGKGFVKIESVVENTEGNLYKISGEHVIGKDKTAVTFYASKSGLPAEMTPEKLTGCAVLKPVFETNDKCTWLKSGDISDKDRNYMKFSEETLDTERKTFSAESWMSKHPCPESADDNKQTKGRHI